MNKVVGAPQLGIKFLNMTKMLTCKITSNHDNNMVVEIRIVVVIRIVDLGVVMIILTLVKEVIVNREKIASTVVSMVTFLVSVLNRRRNAEAVAEVTEVVTSASVLKVVP